MSKTVVIDYGTSNLRSVAKALEHVSASPVDVTVSSDAETILAAERVVFPGQGAIGQCMQELQEQNLDAVIKDCMQNKPFLGICLGLQSLMDFSEEDGGTSGLGVLPGKVKRFPANQKNSNGDLYKIPHMGWSQVKQNTLHALWQNIADNSRFYFVHSYYVEAENPQHITGETEYIHSYASALAHDNVFACQFHPEKSQTAGLQLLKNFVSWNP